MVRARACFLSLVHVVRGVQAYLKDPWNRFDFVLINAIWLVLLITQVCYDIVARTTAAVRATLPCSAGQTVHRAAERDQPEMIRFQGSSLACGLCCRVCYRVCVSVCLSAVAAPVLPRPG